VVTSECAVSRQRRGVTGHDCVGRVRRWYFSVFRGSSVRLRSSTPRITRNCSSSKEFSMSALHVVSCNFAQINSSRPQFFLYAVSHLVRYRYVVLISRRDRRDVNYIWLSLDWQVLTPCCSTVATARRTTGGRTDDGPTLGSIAYLAL